ncbi:MAG TPA: winged helix-turn-helix domain-containing protein [Acidimicrobiales bacterium]|nr:winged helix-turn-helix domain-containing protein [Acidimicrobiales bacterium]
MSDTNQSIDDGKWTFLTNHGHVLVALSRDAELRQRDIADLVGITEGAVQRILHELTEAGYLEVRRVGRRNTYEVHAEFGLRHPLEAGRTVGDLLTALDR